MARLSADWDARGEERFLRPPSHMERNKYKFDHYTEFGACSRCNFAIPSPFAPLGLPSPYLVTFTPMPYSNFRKCFDTLCFSTICRHCINNSCSYCPACATN